MVSNNNTLSPNSNSNGGGVGGNNNSSITPLSFRLSNYSSFLFGNNSSAWAITEEQVLPALSSLLVVPSLATGPQTGASESVGRFAGLTASTATWSSKADGDSSLFAAPSVPSSPLSSSISMIALPPLFLDSILSSPAARTTYNMPTGTIYSDTYMVIVDNNNYPSTAPWLRETTYLINSIGATTAMIAQTAPATYSITPVPWTAAGARAAQGVKTASSSSASAEPAADGVASETVTASPKVIGAIVAVVCILIVSGSAVALWLFRRKRERINSWWTQSASQLTSKEPGKEPESSTSKSSSESSELVKEESLNLRDIPVRQPESGKAESNASTMFDLSSMGGSVVSERPPPRLVTSAKKVPLPASVTAKAPLVSILKKAMPASPPATQDSSHSDSITLLGTASPPNKDSQDGSKTLTASASSDSRDQANFVDLLSRGAVESKAKKGVRFGQDEFVEFGGTEYSKSETSGPGD